MHRLASIPLLLLAACGNVKHGDGGDRDGGGSPDAPPGMQTLEVTVEGSGAVTSEPPGIECPGTCSATFDEGIEVVLTTTPNSDSGLAGWGGDCTGLAPTCAVTMDMTRSAAATFDLHGSARWVGQVSFPGQDFVGHGMVVDPQGNAIVAGRIENPESDIYVAKFDRMTGEVLWDKHIQTATGEYFGGVAVDAESNVYLAFPILGFEPITIDDQEFTPDLYGNIIVARLDGATGDFVWIKQWGGDGQDRPHALAVSGSNLYMVGYSSSSPASFDGLTLNGSTDDAFVVKARLDNGTATRLKHIDGPVWLNAVAADDTRVAVGGFFEVDPTLGTGCGLNSTGTGRDGFVASLAQADLACQWTRDFGDSTNDLSASTSGIAAYPGGGWVATGSFNGNVLWAEEGTALASRGSSDAFAVRYAANGDHVWSFRYGDTGNDSGGAIATTADGATVLAGTFAADITFGAFELSGANDVFVTRMSGGNAPEHEWAVALGGDGTDRAEAVGIDADDSVYVSSYFMGMTVVDGETMTAQDYDGWIAALVR